MRDSLTVTESTFSTGAKWKNRRRIITPAFHDKELLNNFVDIYNEQTATLIRRLASITDQKEINLYPYIASCALDIICGEFETVVNRTTSMGCLQSRQWV